MTDTTKIITESDLLKSITDLEDKAKAKEEPKPEPKIEQVTLVKSTMESIKDGSSAGTRKALDVSDILTDIVGLMGKHNDSALSTLQKSINAAAERDLAMVKVLGDLKKSVNALTEKVEAYGTEPRKPKTPNPANVLHKGISGDETRLDPRMTRRTITRGLEIMAKSLRPDDPKFMEISSAAIKFEATGQIEDRFVTAAQKALAAPPV